MINTEGKSVIMKSARHSCGALLMIVTSFTCICLVKF